MSPTLDLSLDLNAQHRLHLTDQISPSRVTEQWMPTLLGSTSPRTPTLGWNKSPPHTPKPFICSSPAACQPTCSHTAVPPAAIPSRLFCPCKVPEHHRLPELGAEGCTSSPLASATTCRPSPLLCLPTLQQEQPWDGTDVSYGMAATRCVSQGAAWP